MDTTTQQALLSEELRVDEVRERLKPAISILYTHTPFWAMLLENLTIYVTKDIETAAVYEQGNSMYLNPDFVETLGTTHLAFLLAHEVAHVAFNSNGRRQWRDPRQWNSATDYAINSILKASFGSMPRTGLYNENFENISAEEIYELIYVKPGDEGAGDQNHNKGIAPGDILLQPLEGIEELKPSCRAGSEDSKGSEIDWNAEVTKAMTHAKMQGKVSAELERKINGGQDSQVDWRAILRQKVSNHLSKDSRDDFSYIPPNRRYLYQDLVLPSIVGHRKPTLAYSIDTSGSMSNSEISQGLSEIDAIRQMLQARLYLIICDCEVTSAKWIEPYEDIPPLKGGGGTSFIPIFDKLEEEHIDCDVVVIFTDGYGRFPDTDRGYDTIWIMTSNVDPPFGECVNVKIPRKCD